MCFAEIKKTLNEYIQMGLFLIIILDFLDMEPIFFPYIDAITFLYEYSCMFFYSVETELAVSTKN